MKKKTVIIIVIVFLCVFIALGLLAADKFNIFPPKTYTAEDFGIETLKSETDFNSNGTDDYTDILLGARADAKNHPRYDGRYWDEGYPPDNIGVCTDVIWRAFKNAGYNLREMVDKDVNERLSAYPTIEEPDNNIDFRRVRNLHVFFKEYAVSLTLDINEIEQWQPGDIVIFGKDKHIGIVSDKRNSQGQAYIIHNGGQPMREEDYLKTADVTGHYRFDAKQAPEKILIKFES